MTAAQLLSWIAVGLMLQLAVGSGVALWRRSHRTVFQPAHEFPIAAASGDAAWSGWRSFRVDRRGFEDPACTQCSFYLVPVDGQALPPFKPGQFLTFSLDIESADAGSQAVTRCYSLSDRPESAYFRITVKRVPAPADAPDAPPGASSNHLHDHVHEGDVLKVKAPSGHFSIDPDPTVPVVLIGGGIGITPMMSMLRWCFAEQPSRTVHLYYGLRSSREHAFRSELEAMAAAHPQWHLNVVYSRAAEGDVAGRDFQHRGHVDVDLLRRTLPHGRHQFYVCGPPAMMQTLVPALAEWGVPRADLHFEAFGPASIRWPGDSAPATEAAAAFEVRFQRSQRTLAWDGSDPSLLDFAERHGVEVASGCRSGGCGSCETRVSEGQVRYIQDPDHDVAPGHCLLCIGRPVSSVVLEA